MYFVAFLALIQITEVVQQKYINLEIIGTRWKMKLGAAGGGIQQRQWQWRRAIKIRKTMDRMSTFTHALLQMSKSLLTPNKKGLQILLV